MWFEYSVFFIETIQSFCLQLVSAIIWNANVSVLLPVFNVLYREETEMERVKVKEKWYNLNDFVV